MRHFRFAGISLALLCSIALTGVCGQSLRRPLIQGITIPKRSSIIYGLNQQFKSRAERSSTTPRNPTTTTISPPVAQQQNVTSQLASPTTSSAQNQNQTQPQPVDTHQPAKKNSNSIFKAIRNQANKLRKPTASDVSVSSQIQTRSDAASGQIQSQAAKDGGQEPQNSNDISQDSQDSYRGYSLIEVKVKNDIDKRFVQELYTNVTSALDKQATEPESPMVSLYADIDFWSFKSALNDDIDIMVSPKSKAFMFSALTKARIPYRTKVEDIQAQLDQVMGPKVSDSVLKARTGSNTPFDPAQEAHEMNLRARSQPLNESEFFSDYRRLADINQYLDTTVEKNRDIAEVKVIGRSSQGRYLRVLKLGYDQSPEVGDGLPYDDQINGNSSAGSLLNQFLRQQQSVKKIGSIWLDGGTHAREWISPATAMFIVHRLTENHANCLRFFDKLRFAVSQADSSLTEQTRQARRLEIASLSYANHLEADLVPIVNEIENNIRNAKPGSSKAKNELDKTLELLNSEPNQIASKYACNVELDTLLRRYTFYVMPVLNPDGYEYSHTHNRLWRKTRSTNQHPLFRHFCVGTDPNRNYDVSHGSSGSSTHPCGQTYAGATPFTEPETRHQSNFVYANRDSMKMYISLHSYSQMILLPYSYSRNFAPDHKDLESVGQAAARAIEKTHGTSYRVGPSASILYTAAGTASDWAYERAKVKYSYTIELRDTGSFGFLLPRQQIVPTGEETFNGLLAMIEQMERNENFLTGKSTRGPQKAEATSLLDSSDDSKVDRDPPGHSVSLKDDGYVGDDMNRNDILESDVEPADSGLVFEGEGELLEPSSS